MADILQFPKGEIWHSLCQCDECQKLEFVATFRKGKSRFKATIFAYNEAEAINEVIKIQESGYLLVRLRQCP